MALPTLPHRTPRPRPRPATLTPTLGPTPRTTLPDAARELVLTAPMLLFAHGILAWIDDVGQHGRSGAIWFLAQAALIASAFSFVGLAAGLRHVSAAGSPGRRAAPAGRAAGARTRAATLALVAAIAGTGLTAWVALVRGIGGAAATDGAPTWLLASGPTLLGSALIALLALAAPTLGLPRRSLTLAATGAVLLALPLDLIPLAAIVVVLALEPLLRTEPETLEGHPTARAR